MKSLVLILFFPLLLLIVNSAFAQDDFIGDEVEAFTLFGQVQSGEASFSTNNNEFQITASEGAVIRYEFGFDIPAGETVRFIQPSSEATVINRISTQVPTQINGNLLGNGKVVLLNSSGIVFGESATVEVGKLHAIAGFDDPNFGPYFLTATVENRGSLKADEVVLAGSKVINSGSIIVDGGSLVMAAGAGLQLYNDDNSLFVSISTDSPSPVLGVSDLAGQAVVQSGVVQATRAQFHGNTITHNGSIQASVVTVKDYSKFQGASGSLSTSELSVTGGISPSSTQNFDLSGKSNTVTKLLVTGGHQDFKVRSSKSLQVGESLENPNQEIQDDQDGVAPSMIVQNMDLRVDEGDLTLNILPVPQDTQSDNSLLLAAENNLVLSASTDTFTHSRKIMYGRNLSLGTVEENEELALGSAVSLDAISVFIDDLSPTLSPSVIKSLAGDNPGFEGFDSKGGLVELSQMSEDQLNTLFRYGLFTCYSYFFQAPDKSAKLAKDIEEAGGSVALFGGSFAVVASAGGSTAASDSSGGAAEDSDGGDGEGESEGSSKVANSTAGASRRLIGVVPFAPISQPILSVEASQVLEKALAPEVEQKMQQYLNP